ncbi:hypothetical protein EON65_22320 [archaeon]|nr:MAG: hypothetical protein EON65_22320 [archaeon]
MLGPCPNRSTEDWQALKQEIGQENEFKEPDTVPVVISDTSNTDVSRENTDIKTKVRSMLLQYRDQGLKRSEAVKAVSTQLKAPRGVIYALALNEEWK